MANTKSAEKRVRQTAKRTLRNKAVKSKFSTDVNKFKQAVINNEDKETIELKLRQAIKTVDKTVTKGVIHKNKAARIKSQLMRKYNKID